MKGHFMGSIVDRIHELELDSSDITPIRYNGCQLKKNKKQIIGIDYLIVNLKVNSLSDIKTSGRFTMNDLGYGTKFYRLRYEVLLDGEIIGTLLLEPRSPILPELMVKLKLTNQCFYKKLDVRNEVKAFCLEFDAVFDGIERLDIYVDSHFEQKCHPSQVYLKWLNDEFIKKGRGCEHAPFYKDKKDKRRLTGFGFGTRVKTERYFRCYDKTLEQARFEKPHIIDNWKKQGLDRNQPIWRCEIELTGRFFSTIKQSIQSEIDVEDLITIDSFFDLIAPHNLVTLFRIGVKNYFDFKTEKGENIEIFDFENMINSGKAYANDYKTDFVKTGRKVIQKSIRAQQILMKSVFRSYYNNDQQSIWFNCLAEMLKHNELNKYFYGKYQQWIFDMEKECYNPEYDRDFFIEQMINYD